jgi:hypothetical protein
VILTVLSKFTFRGKSTQRLGGFMVVICCPTNWFTIGNRNFTLFLVFIMTMNLPILAESE